MGESAAHGSLHAGPHSGGSPGPSRQHPSIAPRVADSWRYGRPRVSGQPTGSVSGPPVRSYSARRRGRRPGRFDEAVEYNRVAVGALRGGLERAGLRQPAPAALFSFTAAERGAGRRVRSQAAPRRAAVRSRPAAARAGSRIDSTPAARTRTAARCRRPGRRHGQNLLGAAGAGASAARSHRSPPPLPAHVWAPGVGRVRGDGAGVRLVDPRPRPRPLGGRVRRRCSGARTVIGLGQPRHATHSRCRKSGGEPRMTSVGPDGPQAHITRRERLTDRLRDDGRHQRGNRWTGALAVDQRRMRVASGAICR